MKYKLVLVSLLAILLYGCKTAYNSSEIENSNLSIPYEKYKLENGLDVVLHQDHSDPIVAVAIQYGVGSNRETKGHTGFAHLFEHMLFQESEHVPQDQFFKKIQDVGGKLDGKTWQDGTIYYEQVPKNALEMVLWMESDRMGYFINTVTKESFANQKEVVQNEKRQGEDAPYAYTRYIIDKNLFPENHPYHSQVLGELEDIQRASIEDVKAFYNKFYGPNNATLVISGDFNEQQVRQWVEKYFGEIKKGPDVPKLQPQRVILNETKRLYFEDNYAATPQLNMVWPTVEQNTKDAYALNFLSAILHSGKRSSLVKELVEKKKWVTSLTVENESKQLAGKFTISVTANTGVDLDSVEAGINLALKNFEQEGVNDKDLDRIKASMETFFYSKLDGVMGKACLLAGYNIFNNSPDFLSQDIGNIKAVTKEDIMAVYFKYIKDKPFVLTSFIPQGQFKLAAANSEKVQVIGNKIGDAIPAVVADTAGIAKETISTIDRNVEPPMGEVPLLKMPHPWIFNLDNNMKVYGITQSELPMVTFSVTIDGGHLLDDMHKSGMANLLANLMMEGTASKTSEELKEQLDLLGASIQINASNENIYIYGNALKCNIYKTFAILKEILTQPRWDKNEFEQIKINTINNIKSEEAFPNVIARQTFNKMLYGPNNPLSYSVNGSVASVESITMDDVKEFYKKYISPSVTSLNIVGDVTQKEMQMALVDLNKNWKSKPVLIPVFPIGPARQKSTLLFVNVSCASQSEIYIGNIGITRMDKDYCPLQIMNYKLGGAFNSNINMVLREEKGYTYRAITTISGSKLPGTFVALASVRADATGESVKIFRDEIKKYKESISPQDLQFTKNAMIWSNASRFETQFDLLKMLNEMSNYNLPTNYIKNEEEVIQNMTIENLKKVAAKYLDTNTMLYLVVGDAATQFEQFKSMGFDEVKLLDSNMNKKEALSTK